MGWSKQEIQSVKELGDRIGYGNVMDLSSALWQIMLEDKHGLHSGAFIPTIAGFMHPEEAARAINERKDKIDIIREILK